MPTIPYVNGLLSSRAWYGISLGLTDGCCCCWDGGGVCGTGPEGIFRTGAASACVVGGAAGYARRTVSLS